MNDWKQDLGNFFGERGIKDKAHEFSEQEIQEIQKFIQAKIKAAYEKIANELNLYASIKASIIITTESAESIQESITLRVDWIMQPKFFYRIRFAKSAEVLIAIGQFSISDLYGKVAEFNNTDLRNSFALIEEKEIIADFLRTFKTNTDFKIEYKK
jgi:hypothetical protein